MLACWDKLPKYLCHLLWQQFGFFLDRGGGSRGFHSIAGQLALVPQLLNPLPPLQRLLLHVADIALLFRFCHLFRVIGDHRHWRTILPEQLKGIEVDSVDGMQRKQSTHRCTIHSGRDPLSHFFVFLFCQKRRRSTGKVKGRESKFCIIDFPATADQQDQQLSRPPEQLPTEAVVVCLLNSFLSLTKTFEYIRRILGAHFSTSAERC